jgi:hypothetical protein
MIPPKLRTKHLLEVDMVRSPARAASSHALVTPKIRIIDYCSASRDGNVCQCSEISKELHRHCWSPAGQLPTTRDVCWNVFTWARCACNLGNDDELRECWEHLVAMQQPRTRKGASTLFMIVAWHLWKDRNLRLFEQRTAITSVIIDRIKPEANLWVVAGARKIGRLFCE